MANHNNIDIKLDLLDLDTKNYRIFNSGDQAEAIKLMVELEGKNLVELGKDIVDEGPSPIDIPAVIKQPNGDRYTVIEGNRRLTAIRLLENPNLAQDSEITEKFWGISNKYLINPIEDLSCVVFPDKDTAMKWVDRKQGTDMGGAGLRRAGYVQNAIRKAYKGKYENWYAALMFLRNNDFLEEQAFPEREIDQNDIGAVIERVFGTAYLSNELGINITSKGKVTFDNGDQNAGAALLKDILYDLIEKKFPTKEVKNVEDRNNFLKKYIERSVKQAAKSIDVEYFAEEENSSAIQHVKSTVGEYSDEEENSSAIEPVKSSGEERIGEEGNSSKTQVPDISNNNKNKAIYEAKSNPTSNANYSKVKEKSPRVKLVPSRTGKGFLIHHPRINALYLELRRLKISESSASQRVLAGVALRVFLDLTLTHFLINRKIPLIRDLNSWEEPKANIRKKLKATLQKIDPNDKKPELDNVRQAMSDDFHHSIFELNKQVHRLDARTLTQNECIQYWDRYEPLFEEIFMRINDDT